MKKQVLSIEIGDRLSKICLVSKRNQTVVINKSLTFPTPDQVIADGSISNPELLASVINEQLLENGITKIRDVVFVVSSPKIASRKVNLPPVKKKQVASIIATNIAEYFPIDLTNYSITHTVLGVVNGKDEVPVLLTAVPKQLIKDYEKLAEFANFKIEAFDYTANSEYQLFKKLPNNGTVMYLSVDTRQTLVTFMLDGLLLMHRTIPCGSDDMINNIMYKEGFEEEHILNALPLMEDEDYVNNQLMPDIYENPINRISTGVERAIDLFKSSNKNKDIDKVVLLNVGANIVGLKEGIAGVTESEVVTLAEIPYLDSIISGENAMFYASCAASLLSPIEIEFTGAKIKGSRKLTMPSADKSALITFIVLLVIAAIMSGYSIFDYITVQNELFALRDRKAELEPVLIVYESYAEYDLAQQNFEALSTLAHNKNSELRLFLGELEAKMPTNLILLSAACDNAGIILNIEVGTMADAAVVLSQLRTFESIAVISTSSVSESINESGVPTTSFTVVCQYDSEVEDAPLYEEQPLEDEWAVAE